jgi:hypothetical protein
MAEKQSHHVYDFDDLADLPRSAEYQEYRSLSPEQLEWCEQITKDKRANSKKLGNKVLYADRVSYFPHNIAVFVGPSTDVENADIFPKSILAGTKDRTDIVYVRMAKDRPATPPVDKDLIADIEEPPTPGFDPELDTPHEED